MIGVSYIFMRQQFENNNSVMNYQQGRSHSSSKCSTAKIQLDDEDTRHDSTSGEKVQQESFHRIAANSFRRLAELYQQTKINPFELFGRTDITASLETIKEEEQINQREQCEPVKIFEKLGITMTRTVMPSQSLVTFKYDQISHFKLIKAVENSINRLSKLKLIHNEVELDLVGLGLVLVCLGYIQSEKGSIKQQYLRLCSDAKEVYTMPNCVGVSEKNLIRFLCLIDGNLRQRGFEEEPEQAMVNNEYGWFTQKSLFVPADPTAIYERFKLFRDTHLKFAGKELKQTIDLPETRKRIIAYKNSEYHVTNNSYGSQNSYLKDGQRMFKLPVKRNRSSTLSFILRHK